MLLVLSPPERGACAFARGGFETTPAEVCFVVILVQKVRHLLVDSERHV